MCLIEIKSVERSLATYAPYGSSPDHTAPSFVQIRADCPHIRLSVNTAKGGSIARSNFGRSTRLNESLVHDGGINPLRVIAAKYARANSFFFEVHTCFVCDSACNNAGICTQNLTNALA